MKKFTLFLVVAMLAAVQSWATPVIEVSAESLDFGQVDVGYPETQYFTVMGLDLTENINLAFNGRHSEEFEVSPATITPEDAANGVRVTVTYSPCSSWSGQLTLVLSSADAADVMLPITAEARRNATISGYDNPRFYTATVGRSDYSVEVAYFADAEIPPDPNGPVDRSIGPLTGIYELSIDGDDCFSARIIKSSRIANTCTVRIRYTPRSAGTHHATLDVVCPSAGVPVIRVQLNGTATPPTSGDLDGDGMITINDVTKVIDSLLLLNGARLSDQADVNCDGVFNIADVTSLIDMLLSF